MNENVVQNGKNIVSKGESKMKENIVEQLSEYMVDVNVGLMNELVKLYGSEYKWWPRFARELWNKMQEVSEYVEKESVCYGELLEHGGGFVKIEDMVD